MAQINFVGAFENYLACLKSKENDEIRKEKYNLLWETANLFQLVINYIALDGLGINYDFGKVTINKGTRLYRIRDYKDNTDFSNPKEWTAPPSRAQGRANLEGQEALYLGNTEFVCLMETHIKKGNKYVLAEYEVVEDIDVGGFLTFEPNLDLHNKAGTVLNSFIIAPSRSEKNNKLFSFLDNHYGKLSLDNFIGINKLEENSLYLPMKFGVLNQRNRLYDLTNRIFNILSKSYPEGTKYSSCYVPIETIGIDCSDYNIVLYNNGISKVRFVNYTVKTNTKDYDSTDILKTLVKMEV